MMRTDMKKTIVILSLIGTFFFSAVAADYKKALEESNRRAIAIGLSSGTTAVVVGADCLRKFIHKVPTPHHAKAFFMTAGLCTYCFWQIQANKRDLGAYHE